MDQGGGTEQGWIFLTTWLCRYGQILLPGLTPAKAAEVKERLTEHLVKPVKFVEQVQQMDADGGKDLHGGWHLVRC